MNNQVHTYEPLTSENAALVLVDHQVGLMTGVRDYSTGELKHNVVALARAAKALKLPIVVTTTARDSMWGPTFPELVEALPGVEIIDRSSVNAFDDERVAGAIAATGRKKLIFAGISLEVCAAFNNDEVPPDLSQSLSRNQAIVARVSCSESDWKDRCRDYLKARHDVEIIDFSADTEREWCGYQAARHGAKCTIRKRQRWASFTFSRGTNATEDPCW